MGEKIKTIIEELVKQDTLTLNILFSVWAKATQFLSREIDLGLATEAGLVFFFFKSVWHYALLQCRGV